MQHILQLWTADFFLVSLGSFGLQAPFSSHFVATIPLFFNCKLAFKTLNMYFNRINEKTCLLNTNRRNILQYDITKLDKWVLEPDTKVTIGYNKSKWIVFYKEGNLTHGKPTPGTISTKLKWKQQNAKSWKPASLYEVDLAMFWRNRWIRSPNMPLMSLREQRVSSRKLYQIR